jgi:hypothetical protein
MGKEIQCLMDMINLIFTLQIKFGGKTFLIFSIHFGKKEFMAEDDFLWLQK